MKRLAQVELEQIKENYMIGVLATKDDYLPKLGDDDEPVSYSPQSDDVVFYIKPLSPEPKEITEKEIEGHFMSNFYIGFAKKSISNFPSELKYSTDINKKIKYIRELFEGKILLFKPQLTYQEMRERYHKNIHDIFPEDEKYIKGMFFVPVPRIRLSPKEFEKIILSEESIEFKDYNFSMPAPLYILCGDYIYGNIKENQWRNDASRGKNSRVLLSPENIKKVKLLEEDRSYFIVSDRENIVFFNEDFLSMNIDQKLDSEDVPTLQWMDELESEQSEDTLNINEENNSLQEKTDITTIQLDEIEFIHDLKLRAKSQKLIYSSEDLINFHTSMKSSAFTILSGQSGIGKTKLATLYAKTLGLSQENKTLLIMPISPAYTEPGDILGYLNPNTGLYIPADTGLVDFLINAQSNPDQVHMLIMDEMNLSQIEHYFAPFLSLLELNVNERYLDLYNKGSVCHNEHKYKPKIHLMNNVIIVGTMNTDETTKELSDRLLDRSNVVVLEKRSFKDIKNELMENGIGESFSAGQEDAYGTVYLKWRSTKAEWDAFNDSELEFFDQLDITISKVDPLKGFSIRNLIRMGAYLNNLPISQDGNYLIRRDTAIDLFIKQRVITKIRGPIEIYENLIGNINSHGEVSGELYKLFSGEEARSISDFDRTKKELIRKAREMSTNGYAS